MCRKVEQFPCRRGVEEQKALNRSTSMSKMILKSQSDCKCATPTHYIPYSPSLTRISVSVVKHGAVSFAPSRPRNSSEVSLAHTNYVTQSKTAGISILTGMVCCQRARLCVFILTSPWASQFLPAPAWYPAQTHTARYSSSKSANYTRVVLRISSHLYSFKDNKMLMILLAVILNVL